MVASGSTRTGRESRAAGRKVPRRREPALLEEQRDAGPRRAARRGARTAERRRLRPSLGMVHFATTFK